MKRPSRLTKEQIIKRQKEAQALQKKQEEKKKEILARKASLFKKPIGKMLTFFTWAILLFSSLYLIDQLLPSSYSDYNVISTEETRIDLVTGDGTWIPATFFWSYFNESQTHGICIYRRDHDDCQNQLSVLETPIFHSPTKFKYTDQDGKEFIKNLNYSYTKRYILPGFVIIIGLVWVLSKPERNIQVVYLGYFLFFSLPIIMFFIAHMAINEMTHQVKVEMDIQDVEVL